MSDCGQLVLVRDLRPTIDTDTDLLTTTGEIVVGPDGPLKNIAICLGETCTSVAEGRALPVGSRIRFSLTAARSRPTGLRVRCSAPAAG